MRFVFQSGVAVAACFLAIYGCSSGDDGSPQGHAGTSSGGKGGASGSAGKGSAGKPSTGGSAGAGGEAGQTTGGHGGAAPEASAGNSSGGVSGDTGQAGSEPGSAGAAGEAGAGGAGATACIRAISGRYVLRHDGTAWYEPAANTEAVVADAASGSPLKGVIAVTDGSYHGCAVLTDKTVKCWQTDPNYGNGEGQLGNGTTDPSATTYRATPVLVSTGTPLTNVVALAETSPSTQSANNSCAIDGGGKLWCWGDLTWTVNGGTSLHAGYAQAVTLDGATPLTGVLQASLTRELACAVVHGSPNEVWCWGINGSGDLAQGDTTKRQYPVHVLGLSSPTKVVTAVLGSDENTACALDGGSVRCWGYNSTSGAVGAKTATAAVQTPTLVVTADGATALGDVTALVSGYSSFAALRSGSLWLWGTHFENYAADYGVTNVSLLGSSGGLSNLYGVRYVTSDGAYHDAMSVVPVSCGSN